VHIDGPSTSSAGLDEFEPLWRELHQHHLAFARYRGLVQDPQASWQRRRLWYVELLTHGGGYFVAREGDAAVGYAMTQAVLGTDDTFAVTGGIVEIISLIVAESMRSHGIGRALVAAVRDFATRAGIDTLKVAVMLGNERAEEFYANLGFEPAEQVLYLTLE
jgi:ribosomal protein S18 acetylase RimI-like enzyme